MDKTEQALFEAHVVLDAHVRLLINIMGMGPFGSEYAATLPQQLDRVAQAAKAFMALPRPVAQQEQKAA